MIVAQLVGGKNAETRGQWPFRPAATRAMRNRHVMLYDYDFYYLGIYVRMARITILVASKQPQWPQNSNLTSDLKSATSITLVLMSMLPLKAILVASEAIAASKQPLRSILTSDLKSVTSKT